MLTLSPWKAELNLINSRKFQEFSFTNTVTNFRMPLNKFEKENILGGIFFKHSGKIHWSHCNSSNITFDTITLDLVFWDEKFSIESV